MTPEMTNLIAAVAHNSDVEQGAAVLLDGLKARLDACIAGDGTVDPGGIASIVSELGAHSDTLAASVAKNTIADPNAPVPTFPGQVPDPALAAIVARLGGNSSTLQGLWAQLASSSVPAVKPDAAAQAALNAAVAQLTSYSGTLDGLLAQIKNTTLGIMLKNQAVK